MNDLSDMDDVSYDIEQYMIYLIWCILWISTMNDYLSDMDDVSYELADYLRNLWFWIAHCINSLVSFMRYIIHIQEQSQLLNVVYFL